MPAAAAGPRTALPESGEPRETGAEGAGLTASPEPAVELRAISPAAYEGVVRLGAPGVLVFNETYNPRWQLLESGTGRPLGTDHWKVNGFANGFWIPSAGEHRIRLVYQGQDAAARVWRITGWSVAGCLFLLAVSALRRRNR